MWFGEEAARRELFEQLSGLLGPQGGEAVQAVITSARKPQDGVLATVTAVATLLVGATGVFVELQDALNFIWEVRRQDGHGVKAFLRNRLLSFAMVMAIGFLLLVSLIVSASLAMLGSFFGNALAVSAVVLRLLNFTVSLGLIAGLFALIFKILPDVRLSWRDVWPGALLSAGLFNVGKFLLGAYLGHSSTASAYGAAGSLVVLLMWVYYASQTLFFGAEFTRSYVRLRGSPVRVLAGSTFVGVSGEAEREDRGGRSLLAR